jgi:hypothetical protein
MGRWKHVRAAVGGGALVVAVWAAVALAAPAQNPLPLPKLDFYPDAAPVAPPTAERPTMASGPMPAQVLALLQRMRAEVEKNCDYVGPNFADEARRIHTGEAENRGIFGEASDEEAEALRDEGIDIARLPWVPRSDG